MQWHPWDLRAPAPQLSHGPCSFFPSNLSSLVSLLINSYSSNRHLLQEACSDPTSHPARLNQVTPLAPSPQASSVLSGAHYQLGTVLTSKVMTAIILILWENTEPQGDEVTSLRALKLTGHGQRQPSDSRNGDSPQNLVKRRLSLPTPVPAFLWVSQEKWEVGGMNPGPLSPAISRHPRCSCAQ